MPSILAFKRSLSAGILDGGANVRHMIEMLIEDFGYDGLKAPMKKSLEGIKFAGHVGCQTNRPFGIVESAYDHGAEMIVTPCPLCQANVEVHQFEINKKQGTKLNMPVLYHSQLMTIAYGGSAKDAGLNGQLIRAEKLEKIGGK